MNKSTIKCTNCRHFISEGSSFCNHCGAPVPSRDGESSATEKGESRQVSENIYWGKDGKYHWCYEFRMLSNPALLFTIWRVLFFCFVPGYLIITVPDLIAGKENMWSELGETTFYYAIFMCVMLAIGALAYLIVAAQNGWRYCVMFEMDEKGITHTQMPKQFKKTQGMAKVLVLAGIVTGNAGRVGQGMMVHGHSTLCSSWDFVKNVKILRRYNTIKVNERLFKNQVYAEGVDFDFVANYIKEHVGPACKINE